MTQSGLGRWLRPLERWWLHETLAGRIGLELVEAEIERLRWLWRRDSAAPRAAECGEALLGADAWAQLDRFEQLQLQAVLAVCAQAGSLSEAGRQLFNISRTQRSVLNDADRLRKYLARYQLSWERLSGRFVGPPADAPGR